jgi:hypothetical protein
MPIDSTHPQYEQMAPLWRRCRDVAGGSDAVKAKTTTYLPCPGGMDPWRDYPAYLARALFFGAMARTIDGLAGSILQKAPTITAPPRVQPWLRDVTLGDQSLDLLAASVIREVLAVGRGAVLVDHTPEGASEPRPYMAFYDAEAIVSWRVERRGGDQQLVRAVLFETVEEPAYDDDAKIVSTAQYRELALTPEGLYQQRVHVKLPRSHVRDPGRTIWIASPWITPTRRGAPLQFIPLVVFGASALGPSVERPPLVDLADVNLSHYRSSADREHALYWVSSPTPWVAGAKGSGPMRIGSSVAWDLEKDGRAGMVEMTGQGVGALRDAMQEKAAMMASLGARLLEAAPSVAETAQAVQMRHSGEHASLRAIAQVASQGLTMALRWFAWWAGTEDRPADVPAAIELSKDFFSMKLSADELRSLVLAWQADGISFETLHHNLQRGDLMRPGVSVDDERHAIEHEMPPALPRPADDNNEEEE